MVTTIFDRVGWTVFGAARRRRIAVIRAMALGILSCLGVSCVGSARAAGLTSGETGLGPLLEQYTTVASLHFKANCHMVVDENAEAPAGATKIPVVTSDGEYEFWWSGGKYRIRSQIDKSRQTPVYEVAFDFNKFQFFEGDQAKLSLSTNNTDEIGAVTPNPLLAPFEFLLRPENGPAVHQPMMENLPKLAGRLKDCSVISDSPLVMDFPGGVMEGQQFFYRVHTTTTNSLVVPSMIELVGTNAAAIVRTFITYQGVTVAGKPTFWPSKVSRKGYSRNGGVVLSHEATVTALEFTALEDSTFVLDPGKARVIFDVDSKKPIKAIRSTNRNTVRWGFFAFLAVLSIGVIGLIRKTRMA